MPTRRTVLAAAFGATLPARAAPTAPRLRRGISLWPWFSLTKEYPGPRTDYAWPPFQDQRPVPRRDDLRRLGQAGFDFVRIPVDPGPFLAFDGTPFRRRLLDELDDAVGLCLATGLDAVVNVQINEATHHWNSRRLIAGRTAPDFAAYRALVAEIARRLAGLDPARTVLEPVNEPPQACGSAEWAALQRDLLAAARAAAPTLTLTATGACGSMVPGLRALDPKALSDEADAGSSRESAAQQRLGDASRPNVIGRGSKPLAGLGPLAYVVHFYEPYLFTHQGAPWMRGEPIYRALNAVPWPASAGTLDATLQAVRRRMAQDTERTAAEKAAALAETEGKMRDYFDARPDRAFLEHGLSGVRDWARANGIAPERILIGEFGALRSDARYVAAGAADRARYIRDLRETIEGCGFGWAYWNFFDGFGLVTDDATRAFDPAIVAALGLRMPG